MSGLLMHSVAGKEMAPLRHLKAVSTPTFTELVSPTWTREKDAWWSYGCFWLEDNLEILLHWEWVARSTLALDICCQGGQ